MKPKGPTKIQLNFGIAVRRRRHELGWSQFVFAEKAGIHRTYVSAIERGKVDMGLNIIKSIADALQIPLSKLIKETES